MNDVSSALAFIHEVMKFGEEVLDLDFGRSFQEVSKSHTATHFLYVSYPDRIKSALTRRTIHSWEKSKLLMRQREYEGAGYDTYLFTAEAHGGGNCPILPMLLEAPLERQVSVILHEGVHTTLGKNRRLRIPYDLEEAGASLVDIMAAQLFARTRGDEMLLRRTEQSAGDWLKFCEFVNWARERLSEVYERPVSERRRKREEMLAMVQTKAEALRKELRNQYLVNKFSQPVNNALLLRYGDYTMNYPFLLEIHYTLGSDVRKSLEMLLSLPYQKKSALRKLRAIVRKGAVSR